MLLAGNAPEAQDASKTDRRAQHARRALRHSICLEPLRWWLAGLAYPLTSILMASKIPSSLAGKIASSLDRRQELARARRLLCYVGI